MIVNLKLFKTLFSTFIIATCYKPQFLYLEICQLETFESQENCIPVTVLKNTYLLVVRTAYCLYYQTYKDRGAVAERRSLARTKAPMHIFPEIFKIIGKITGAYSNFPNTPSGYPKL